MVEGYYGTGEFTTLFCTLGTVSFVATGPVATRSFRGREYAIEKSDSLCLERGDEGEIVGVASRERNSLQ